MSKVEMKSWVQPLHQSSVNMCLRCKRCYMFRYRWCITPKVLEFKPAATLGNIIHRLLQLGPDSIPRVRDEISDNVLWHEAKIEAGEDLVGEHQKMIRLLEDHLERAIAVARIFWEKHPPAPNLEVLASEKAVAFTLDLEDKMPPVLIAGRLDSVLKDTDTGDIYIRDTKTSGRDVAFTITGYSYSLQCRFYRILAASEFEQVPKGFILDVLQTPGIKLCGTDIKAAKAEGISPEEAYLNRCKEWYETQGKKSAQSFYIQFAEPILPAELQHDLRLVSMYQTAPAEPKAFPRDSTASYCRHFEKTCRYYSLCSVSEDAWPHVIEEKYQLNTPVQESESTGDQQKGAENGDTGSKSDATNDA